MQGKNLNNITKKAFIAILKEQQAGLLNLIDYSHLEILNTRKSFMSFKRGIYTLLDTEEKKEIERLLDKSRLTYTDYKYTLQYDKNEHEHYFNRLENTIKKYTWKDNLKWIREKIE